MNRQPEYLLAINIRCCGQYCSKILKSNGVAIIPHIELNHRTIPDEKVLLCRYCSNKHGNMKHLTGPKGSFTRGRTVEVEPEKSFAE